MDSDKAMENTKDKIYGVGIIGHGFMGKAHTYAYKTIPLFYGAMPLPVRLVGVCGRNAAATQSFARENGFDYAADDYNVLIADKNIDIIHVCTPNAAHYDMVKKALLAGKHVYCDKPLATSQADARELCSLAAQAGTVASVAFQNVCFPAFDRALELINAGALGDIHSFRACYLHSGSVDKERPAGWRLLTEQSGGGVILDLGSHALHMLFRLVGAFKSVYAENQTLYPQRRDKQGVLRDMHTEDASYMVLNAQCGAKGTLEISKIATGENDALSVEIRGDRGAIRFSIAELDALYYYDNTAPAAEECASPRGYTRLECVHRYKAPGDKFPGPKASVGWLRGHADCLYRYLCLVKEGKPDISGFSDAMYIQKVMDAAYTSARLGTPVTI